MVSHYLFIVIDILDACDIVVNLQNTVDLILDKCNYLCNSAETNNSIDLENLMN